MDIEYALRNMPYEIRQKVSEAVRKYQQTGNRSYAELAISILEQFDDSTSRELIRVLKK